MSRESLAEADRLVWQGEARILWFEEFIARAEQKEQVDVAKAARRLLTTMQDTLGISRKTLA